MKTTPNHRPSVGWIAGLFALMAFLPFCSVQAQTTQPRTITLCVTPFGAVYLIHQPGLPDACRSDQHVEIALQVAVSGESQQATAAPPPGVGPAIVQSLNTLSGGLTLTGSGGTTITDDGLGAIDINTFSGSHADLTNLLPDQHHTPYADGDAVAAMASVADGNPLNHDRYTDEEAVAAVGPGSDGHSLDAADGSPTDALFVDNDGNVGIGTTSPTAKLEVRGVILGQGINPNPIFLAPGNAAAVLGLFGGATGAFDGRGAVSGFVTAGVAGSSALYGKSFSIASGLIIDQAGTGNIAEFQDAGTPVVVIRDGGNVGIGTTSPGAKLEVAGEVKITGGTPGAGKVLTSDAAGLASWQTASAVADGDWTISGNNIFSAVSGNVGIGTPSPAAKLHVSGQLFAITSGAGPALFGSTTGTGPALLGTTTGTSTAGLFEISNPSNSQAALLATTNGAGSALFGRTTGTGVPLVVQANGTGPTIAVFQSAGVTKARIDKNGTVTATAFAGNGAALTNLPSAMSDHGLLSGLFDDDHTQYLLGGGVRPSTNGFAVTGNVNSGTIPTSGPGTRIMWYPHKAAFRAGKVTATEWDNINIGFHSTAMGFNTTAKGGGSTAMGSETVARGLSSTAMGRFTKAIGDYSTAMGRFTDAFGDHSTAMGRATTASGDQTTAMGTNASTNSHRGSFVYGDASTSTKVFARADNSFVVRAAGGFRFRTSSDLSTGCNLPANSGTFSCASDRNLKQNFRDEDGEAVLAEISRMTIQSWNWKGGDPKVRHLGPTAQDFYAAFRLGEGETTISTVDLDGVNLLAVQALEKRTTDLRAEVAGLREENAELLRRLMELEAIFRSPATADVAQK